MKYNILIPTEEVEGLEVGNMYLCTAPRRYARTPDCVFVDTINENDELQSVVMSDNVCVCTNLPEEIFEQLKSKYHFRESDLYNLL